MLPVDSLGQARVACATCLRRGRGFVLRYRDFVFAPPTLFTFVSLLLLVVAAVQDPAGLVSSGSPASTGTRLYAAAAMVGSAYIWWSAVQGIRQRDFTADIPVSIATAAAMLIGQFSAAAVVAVLLLIGGLLENFVAARAGKALEALAALLPSFVTRRRGDHDEKIPLELVEVGDRLLVRSGERIAVDGQVTNGTAAVDQAAITGESLPVEKTVSDSVFAGTLCQSGALEVRTDRLGEETTLGQIRRMVAAAHLLKAPIERLLDRYAKLYTPTAIVLGLLLWWWSGDPLRAITMLIVFCPCVMVLATPTALVASIGNAALRGSLVKKGATIEALAHVDTVAFDKTGTITRGEPRLVQIISFNGLAEPELLRLAASAEKFSEHPLARAVVSAATERGLVASDPREFAALPGLGVEAVADGQSIALGSRTMLAERGVVIAADAETRVIRFEEAGRGVIPIAVCNALAGLLVVEDTLRPEACGAIATLNRMGIRTVLVSGDNRRTVERIAREVGISEVQAEVLPVDKVAVVQRLQMGGRRKVAFVGDGVNDGPALAAADVGVAMGLGGTDVAIETADIALVADDLSRLPHLLDLSRGAVHAIRQNLVFSLAVLAGAVGLTVPGILTPVTGALLHELSSIPVIINSARLIGRRETA